MSGSLLVSGNPQHFKAIGEGGQPVYAVAFQLREAIRLKAGAATANCLAIPQSNQHGSMVDWYSPIEGDVVPWSAASSQERERALVRLDAAHRTLESAIVKMRLTDARDSQAEREKNTVLPLMSKVFYFPDPNFIYLVNGEPVIAFWGFHTQGAGLPADPFVALRPVPMAPVAPIMPAVKKPLRRPWWWWLLLVLLLLLLLFLLLRSCAPASWFGLGQAPGVTAPPVASPSALPSFPSRTVTAPDNPVQSSRPVDGTVRAVPEGWIDRGASVVRRWWSGSDPAAEVTALTPHSQAPIDETPIIETPVTEPPVNIETPVTEPPLVDSPEVPTPNTTLSAPPALVPPEVGAGQTNNSLQDAPLTGGDSPAATQNSGELPSQQNPRADTSATQPAQPAQPVGGPMTIPQQAINAGDTRFLDGSWTAGTGIQDAKTGKPLRIEYDFSQGKGQGRVTIRRADGSQCVGAVSAQMQGQSLQINDQGVAKCSDGGTMALPKVTCIPQSNGQANCQGRYENGATFPVSMRHAPK